MRARAFLALGLICASVYYADDFVKEFGIRALPIGVIALIVACYAIAGIKPK